MQENSLALLGIGIGPANLALATAIADHGLQRGYWFLEKKPNFSWHPGMLLQGAKLQVPFLRDLATFRNPQSRFTFLNYLKIKKRLDQFLNLRTFYPTRIEFYDYLSWACEQLPHLLQFNCEVNAITPVFDKNTHSISQLKIQYLNGHTQQTTYLTAKNVVLGMGRCPFIPEAARINDSRLIHTSNLLHQLPQQFSDTQKTYHFMVIGSGQSAGEAALYLLNHYPNAHVHLCFRSFALQGIDNSPFVNPQYHEIGIDHFFQLNQDARQHALQQLKNSNYSVIDLDLLKELYQLSYDMHFQQQARLTLHSGMNLKGITSSATQIQATLENLFQHSNYELNADGIILATGYTQTHALSLLNQIEEFLLKNEDNTYKISRNYRLTTRPELSTGIYLQGYCENSHGPGDSTLSVLATRAEKILNDILQNQHDLATRKAAVK